jgi:hypothetical protein
MRRVPKGQRRWLQGRAAGDKRTCCIGRVSRTVRVGEMAGEEDVETVWKKKLRYGGGLSGMRAGKYGTVNVRDGSGWRVAGVGAIMVRVEGRDCENENEEETR